jgi:hypothetical protein
MKEERQNIFAIEKRISFCKEWEFKKISELIVHSDIQQVGY